MNIINELSEFTGLPVDKVKRIVKNKEMRTHTEQFEFFNPKTQEELDWFYKTNTGYLFALARRKFNNSIQKAFDIFKINKKNYEKHFVIDFGCGIGMDSISLFQSNKEIQFKNYYFDFVEQNVIQCLFIRKILYKVFETKIDYEVYGEPELYLNILDNQHCFLIMNDVIEHLGDYKKILKRLLNKMLPTSILFEHSPFGKEEFGIHFKDKYNLPKLLESLGMKKIDEGIWEKI